MNGGNSLACNARSSSGNASPLVGFPDDANDKVAVEVGFPSSLSQDDSAIVVSALWRRVLEGKEESRTSALELSELDEALNTGAKLKDKSGIEEEAQKIVAGGECDELLGMFPLRRYGFGSSRSIDIRLEVECIDNDRDYNCGEVAHLISSRLPKEGPMVDLDGDFTREETGSFCSLLSSKCMDASMTSKGYSIEGRCEILPIVDSEKVNFDMCNGNVTCLDYPKNEDNKLSIIQNVKERSLQYSKREEKIDGVPCSLVILEDERFGTPNIEQETSCSTQGSPTELTYCSAPEGSFSEKPSQALASMACCSNSYAELDIKGGNFDTHTRSASCSNDNGSCGEADRGKTATAKCGPINVISRRPNPKRGASLRSSLSDEKFNLLFRIRSDGRKCRRKLCSSSSSSNKLTTKFFSEVKRKKRGSDRQARLSPWGAVENLFHIIKHDGGFINHDSQANQTVRKSMKVRSEAGSRSRVPALKNGLTGMPATKRAISSQCIMVDTLASLQNSANHLMVNLDGHTVSETSNRFFKFEQNFARKKYDASVRSTQTVVQHGDKDPESSLTQETSADNLPGEYYGIFSQANVKSKQETVDTKQPSDPGTSPDSNVYHPLVDVGVMAFEGSVSTNAGSGMHLNILNQELQAEDCLPSSASAFIEPSTAPPFVLAKKTYACWNPKNIKKLLKDKKGKEGKKEKKGKKNGHGNKYPSSFSDHHVVETKLDCPGVNIGIKASLSTAYDLNQQYASNEGAKCSESMKKHYKGGLNSDRCSVDYFPGLLDSAYFNQSLEVRKSLDSSKMHMLDVSKGKQSETLLSSGYGKSHQLSRSARVELHKGRLSCVDSPRGRRQFTHGKHKKNMPQSDVDCKEGILLKENRHIGFSPKIANELSFYGGATRGEMDASNALCEGSLNNVAMPALSELSARELYHVLLDQSSLSGQNAWALCDDCQKWRCIPEELVHVIENSRWTCKDNVDYSFADCKVPQEKTNEVINRELDISDEENCSTVQPGYWDIAPQKRTSARRARWTLIQSNLFLNRSRKTQTIDEIMVCYCKPPKDGGLGCRDECLNHMLNIECVKGTCPCEDLCSNQQFQKGKYAKFKWMKCGKKGYGLQLEENVSRGQFLIEYVGEVLDLAAYEARLRYYASRAHKHFYFMTLNGGEVIDACGKGNLGRFVNHSCNPNCRTEKWMVNGEVCIGLFAIRDIKKGEEVTFDYNYVRVFGAAAKKCVCGSAECQGYIGGDPSKSEVIVQEDSTEEDLEPEMIDEGGEIVLAVEGIDSDATDDARVIKHEDVSIDRDYAQGTPALVEQETFVEIEGAMQQPSSEPNHIDLVVLASDCIESKYTACGTSSNIQSLPDSKLVMGVKETNQTFCGPVNDDQQLSTIVQPLPTGQLPQCGKHSLNIMQTDHAVHESVLNLSTHTLQNSDSIQKKKLITYPVEENPSASKPYNFVESSCPTKIKRSKANIKSEASQKAMKVQPSFNDRHIQGVEEKLNELLDGDGGISRQKDSAKWYLKLLVVTAAAGDDIKGGLSQSARDLSLILDAILKTKSRTVLVDIVNKNGLQMLHNMMKQNRVNFNRIPILRKLLKVLEFLAEKQILTLEHINGAPPCRGMESFKESMLKLMKHRDSQVHTIARNFADHWIPRTLHRIEHSDRDYRQFNSKCFHNSSVHTSKFKPGHDYSRPENDAICSAIAATCLPTSPSVADIGEEASHQQVSISASIADRNQIARPRKRKRRWDQPLDITKQASQTSLCTGEPISVFDISLQISGTLREGNISSVEAATALDLMQPISDDDDLPPGFELPSKDDHLQALSSMNATKEMVMGHMQERYLPHLPVSFGIPLVLTQQLGTLEIESNNQFDLSWRIAPAIPFKPFPPLPSYPRIAPEWINPYPASDKCSNESSVCPSHGNVRSFFSTCKLNNQRHQKYCSKFPQGGTGCRFDGGYRSQGPALDVGNLMHVGGGGCLPDGLSSKFNLNFHQEHHT